MRPINIFIIDDDKLFVFLTKKTINATKVSTLIKEFGDGEEALNYLKQSGGRPELLPDIIMLDLSMPIMDGWEFLEEYKLLDTGINSAPKLYIFSSSISPHDLERAKTINFVSDFIIKPLLKEKFIEIIENL